MYCVKCGNKLNDEALFCSKCGTKVNKMLFHLSKKEEDLIIKQSADEVNLSSNSFILNILLPISFLIILLFIILISGMGNFAL